MVAVPEYKRQVQLRPTNQQAASVQTSDDTFGGGVGRAMQTAGQGIAKVADAVAYKQQLVDDADAKGAFNDYRKAQQEYLLDPQNGVLNQTGGNAINAHEHTEAVFAKLQKQHSVGLKGAALRAYEDRVNDLAHQGQGRVLSHESAEARNYVINGHKSTVEGYIEEAASNWNDPELYEHNLNLAKAEQRQLARVQGWDAATLKVAEDTLVSGATRSRIVQMATKDPLGAEKMLNESRDMLSADDQHALDTGLKSLVLDAKVNVALKPFIKSGVGAAGGSSYDAKRIHAESGGNPYAANNKANPGFASPDGTYSSALGLNQQLRGTYLRTVKQMQSEGGAAWAAGMSDNEIAATRTNPKIDNSVQAYRERQEAAIVVSAGFQDTPTSRYAMHHFGAGGGISLLKGARDNPGAPASTIFSAAVMKSNPQFKGKTIGQALDWVSNHLGADDVTASGGSFFDASAAMQAALAIEDPEVQAAAMAKINTLMTMQDRMRSNAQGEAQRAAWDHYSTTGDDQLPLDMKRQMGQAGWTAFQAAVSNDQNNIDVTDENTWRDLTELAGSDPKAFSEVELEAYRPTLSKSDMRSFIEMQQATNAKMAGDALASKDERNSMNYSQMFTAADDIYAAMVDDTATAKQSQEQRQRRVEFERNLMRMANDFYDKEQRVPNTEDVRKMASVLAMPVNFFTDSGFFGGGFDGRNEQGSGSFFDVENRPPGTEFELAVKYDDIPTSERTAIAYQIMMANGGELATPEEIEEVYEQRQLMSVGIPPHVDIASVPEWLIDIEKGDNPNVTDEELVDIYQQYLMSQQ